MNERKLTPKHIEALHDQIRGLSYYLLLLQRRLLELNLSAEEPELFDYLSEAAEASDYLRDYLQDRTLRDSRGGWDRHFHKRARPNRKLKRVK